MSDSEKPLPARTDPENITALSSIENRIARADSPQDISLLVQARGEILRQNEAVKDANQQRSIESTKIKFSITAFTVGTVLIIAASVGSSAYSKLLTPGLAMLGAGLYGIAPGYVKTVLSRGKGEENAEN